MTEETSPEPAKPKYHTTEEFTSYLGFAGNYEALRASLAAEIGADLDAGDDVAAVIVLDVKSGPYWLPMAETIEQMRVMMSLSDSSPQTISTYRLRATGAERIPAGDHS